MAEVLDWPRDNPAVVAVRAARHLRNGLLAVVPTDTTYALAAHGLSVAAVARLVEMTGQCPVVALADPHEVKDWLPYLDGLGARLARHCWPGPLTLQSAAGAAVGLCQRLPVEVRELLLRDGLLSIRSAGHVAMSRIIPLLDGPLVFAELPNVSCVEEVLSRFSTPTRSASEGSSASEAPQTPTRSASEGSPASEGPLLIIHDGPTYFGQASTVVKVEGRNWTETSAGVLSREILADLVQCRILFVCTGNTCRSPLAMALCRILLAQRLGCTLEELPERGFQVQSAGLGAIMGEAASPEAVEVVREMGGDLAEHRSQPLSIDLLGQADCLFTMTDGHLRILRAINPTEMGPLPCMLSPANQDVYDPIGCPIDVYRQCARQILDCLEERLPQLLEM